MHQRSRVNKGKVNLFAVILCSGKGFSLLPFDLSSVVSYPFEDIHLAHLSLPCIVWYYSLFVV